MSKLLQELFYIKQSSHEFQKSDSVLEDEIAKRFKSYETSLSPCEYENLRDQIFCILNTSKKSAFEIGFKTAINIIMESIENK